MSGNYPELERAQSLIKETLKTEEEKFLVLLDRGIKILNEELNKVKDTCLVKSHLNFMILMAFL